MDDELRKIDMLRERTHLGYEKARELLQEAGGDVVAALILWERRGGGKAARAGDVVDDVAERVRDVVGKGNRTVLRISQGEETYLKIPVTAGIIGAVLAPWLALAGGAAAVLTGCDVKLEPRERGQSGAQPAS